MRRSLSARVAALVFVTFMATAPAFAAPRRDDSPIGGIEQTISRIFKQIVEVLDLIEGAVPK
ncbi:MAG TPA: hypothetical protein VER58_09675 [Thermoanaerobaculia bacterium]|nr:hypothetical protein [Thermoanaerobaculia bacterium]